jgi:predicted nucleic acid-binding protein
LTIDLDGALRRRKPDRWRRQIARRPLYALVAAADIVSSGRPALVPDTNVYIMAAADRLPLAAALLLERALLFHCAVCLAELTVGIANADPAVPGWSGIRDHYAELFSQIPESLLLVPDPQVWVEAGLVAGTLARVQGFQPHQRKECLNDAAIFLTAARAGLPVLTANTLEFDLIQQIAPEGRFIHF